MLISKYYVQKSWTKHERKSAQERALKENRAYILPVRIDSTPLPGLHETVLCFDLQRKSIDQLVETILLKLRDINSAHVVTDAIPPLPIIEKTINLQTSEDFISTFLKTLKNEFNEINSIDNLWRLLDALKISSYYNLYDDIQAKYDKIVYGSKMLSLIHI